jgi:WW domain-binding protein 2
MRNFLPRARIILFSDNVIMEFSGNENPIFKGKKTGRAYLTTHRMIFNNKNTHDGLQSLSFPFITLSDVEIEQPVFGGNYIRGKVRPQENGNWTGEVKFKLLFKSGGAIDYGQAMLKAASLARRNNAGGAPPPYVPPTGSWYQAPPPAYSANPQGYYGWSPNTANFAGGPEPGTVFMHDSPPPYPGIVPGMTQPSGPAPGAAYNGGQPYGAMGYPSNNPMNGYPAPGFQSNGFQQAPYPDAAGNFPQPPYPGAGPAPAYPNSQPSSSFPGYPNLPNPGQEGAFGFAPNAPPASKSSIFAFFEL